MAINLGGVVSGSDSTNFRGRIISSIAATCIALACGTNYVYSAWGPQFAAKLHLSATEAEFIGLAGNLGMYLFGIPVGIFVDAKGPRPAVLIGAAMLIVGYFPLHTAFNAGGGNVPLLCFFSTLSGLGGCTAFSAAIKVSALNWPNHRGTATAFPLAAFGLSAFFFALLSSILFHGETGQFLLLLALGTSIMTFVGFFFLRVLPTGPLYDQVNPEEGMAGSHELGRAGGSIASARKPAKKTANDSDDSDEDEEEESDLVSRSSTDSMPGDVPAQKAAEAAEMDRSQKIDIRGLQLLKNMEFWQLWCIMGILSGIGIMTINNIGNDSTALWRKYDPSITEESLVLHQQMHVSILSIGSFSGRLLSGVGSDFLVKTLKASRVWCLVIASAVFSLAQFCALNITNPNLLGFVSGFSGLGYGFLFGVYPSLTAESFGMTGLSQNWGAMTLSPVVSSNIFNLFYGAVYDAHSVVEDDGERTCDQGIDCYWNAYLVTLAACALGVVVTLWTIWAQKRARISEKIYGGGGVH